MIVMSVMTINPKWLQTFARKQSLVSVCLLLTASAVAQELEKSALLVEKRGDLLTVVASNEPLSRILAALEEHMDLDLVVPPELLSKTYTINLTDGTPEQLFEQLASGQALIYERWGDSYKLVSARLTTRGEFVEPPMSAIKGKDQATHEKKVDAVASLIESHRLVFNYAGELDYAAAKALIDQRKAQVEDTVRQLAALGPGGARAMLDVYGRSDTAIRERLLLIEALAQINDPLASTVLAGLYAEETSYSLHREIIGALGQRKDVDTDATITSIMDASDDKRIRAAAVQAMSGRESMIPALSSVLKSPAESLDVRQESIRSLGLVKNEPALEVLVDTASSAGNAALQKTAIQEMARSYGVAALPALTTLSNDPDEAIRYSAVKALSRLPSESSTALLKTISEEDPSAAIRQHAERYLTARKVPAVEEGR